MKKIPAIIASIIFLLTACTSKSGDSAYPNPSYPDPSNSSQSSDYIPSPADSTLSRSKVFLDSTELLTLESFPLQFSLHLKGNLPTPCHQLRVSVSPANAENKVNVDVYSVVDPNTICVQSLEPFDVNFNLGSYPTGYYYLYVNGTLIAEFTA